MFSFLKYFTQSWRNYNDVFKLDFIIKKQIVLHRYLYFSIQGAILLLNTKFEQQK